MLGAQKRSYRAVTLAAAPQGHRVLLDERPLRTPGKRDLTLPTEALAAAVAAEWAAQETEVRPASMPMTQLCCTTLDLVEPQPEALVQEIATYGGTDLLCYRADQPEALVRRQRETWQPLLDWAALALDAPLTVTSGVVAVSQPDSSLAALRAAVAEHRGFALTALAQAVRLTGSLVLGLALGRGRLDAEGAFTAAELDETFQMEQWGEDVLAVQRRAALRAELAAVERLLQLLRAGA